MTHSPNGRPARARTPGAVFLAMGVIFLAAGSSGQRTAFIAVGAAFIAIGVALLVRRRRAASTAIGLGLLMIGISRVVYTADEISPADARRELLTRQFTIVTKTQEVPEPVRVLLAALTKTHGRLLAEPGAKYQATDVIAEPGLPRRRLLFGGNGKGIYFVSYEMGGRGHSYHVAVFEFVPGRISLVWRAILEKRLDNLKDLRVAIRKGQYRDDASDGF